MHYTGEVYRHPMEANTPLLEVTIGCSHLACTFCTMYRNTPFGISPMEHIEEDLEELKSYGRPVTRLFLVNADAFVLSTDKLARIAERIISYFPEVETITCYASIKNLKNKSPDDLKRLRKLRYNDLHIGLETGYNPALAMLNKGFDKEEAYRQLYKLKEAGFQYDALLMLGAAGKGKSEINARETANLLNETKPYMVTVLPISVVPGSKLETLCQNGEYVEQTELEMLEEEKRLLSLLEIKNCYFFGSHYFNLVPVSSDLKYKKEIIEYIDRAMKEMDEAVLHRVKPRGRL